MARRAGGATKLSFRGGTPFESQLSGHLDPMSASSRREKVTTVNADMERRADRLASLFPAPLYRVELIANETMIWIHNERSGVIAEIGESDFQLEPEGEAELDYIRKTLA
jgi:hypothetical protein